MNISEIRHQAELGREVDDQLAIARAKATGQPVPRKPKPKIKQETEMAQPKTHTVKDTVSATLAGIFILGLVFLLLLQLFASLFGKGEASSEAIPPAHADNLPVEAQESAPAVAEKHWSFRWNDLQGGDIEEIYLWHIAQHWDQLTGSGCDPYLMAAIWYRETGMDVTSKNPFQEETKVYPTFDAAAKGGCIFLKNKARGNLPETITSENIPIVADALFKYNGTRYGEWQKSPYVVNNLDSGKVRMPQCAVNGCGKWNKSKNDGALTFYLKLIQDLHK